jgi:isocitrate dehydrogenase kinase/phosphatase
LTDEKTRECFMRWHADLLSPEWWQAKQNEILAGRMVEVLSYSEAARLPQSVQPQDVAQARSP